MLNTDLKSYLKAVAARAGKEVRLQLGVKLEVLDLIVDARSREVRVNPAHPDGPILLLLAVA